MLTIFHVQNVLIILDWCLCEFLLLKHINEVHALHLDLSFTNVDIFFYVQNVLIILNWCLCDFLVLKHIDEVDVLHPHLSYTASDYLLMLTIFHVENVVIILNWCLCDFLFLKDIGEVDGLHLHLSLTDVDIFFLWKIFYDFNTGFDYLLMLTYFSCVKCIYHSWLMFMWFSVTETYWWSGWTSSSFVIDIFLCVENIFFKIFLSFQYCFWLFTDVFCVENILWFHIFTDVDIENFSCAKCSYHSWLMFMWFSVSETYQWSGWTSSSFVTYWCWHIFRVENILRFQYCFWLFTDVDIFFMCKIFLSFSTDVYVIFLYWNISIQCTYFIFIYHLLMLTYLRVENVPQFQYCFWLFTDVDYFSCAKMFLSCSHHIPEFQYCFLIIYWCWLFFMCQSFFKKFSLSSGHKVSLRKFL